VQDRGQYLHHPKHAEAILKRCQEVGVPVVANLPGLKIAPPDHGPKELRAFLFQHLGVVGE
jgi:hypothetical protein